MYKRILVPLDGSTLAERALSHAVEVARNMGGHLWLLQVLLAEVYVIGPLVDEALYSEDILEQEQKAATDYLTGLKARLEGPDLPVHVEVLNGSPAETIVDYAKEKNIDLIVMSTHGRSGLSRWVFGSVTDKVLRGAHCPTLIVRGQLAA